MAQEDLFNIKTRKEFASLHKSGKKIAGKYFFFIFRSSEKKGFAVIVSKKMGKAVKRNYEKRVMRVLIRKYHTLLVSLRCLVIRIPKRDGSFKEKEDDFKNTLMRLNNMSIK